MADVTKRNVAASSVPPIHSRIERYGWPQLGTDLDAYGYGLMEKLLSPEECLEIAGLYRSEEHFRSHVHMAEHGFGRGEYRYFKYPLPALIRELRTSAYRRLAPFANRWNERLGLDSRYPDDHTEFLRLCREAGQTRPTPLLLRYVANDFNCLHQDLYGDWPFPFRSRSCCRSPAATLPAANSS
jgi:hypothetical protein